MAARILSADASAKLLSELRELAAITRPLCAENGLPYREEGFLQALVSVTRHVRDIARRFGR